MNVFDNVTVRKEANIYYDGKVTSRVLLMDDGTRKTLGFVLPGEYEFSTDSKEVLEILSGTCVITCEGSETTYQEGDIFSIPAKTSFLFKAVTPTDYCCSYMEES